MGLGGSVGVVMVSGGGVVVMFDINVGVVVVSGGGMGVAVVSGEGVNVVRMVSGGQLEPSVKKVTSAMWVQLEPLLADSGRVRKTP